MLIEFNKSVNRFVIRTSTHTTSVRLSRHRYFPCHFTIFTDFLWCTGIICFQQTRKIFITGFVDRTSTHTKNVGIKNVGIISISWVRLKPPHFPNSHAILQFLLIMYDAQESFVSSKLERSGGLVFFQCQAMRFRHQERSAASRDCRHHALGVGALDRGVSWQSWLKGPTACVGACWESLKCLHLVKLACRKLSKLRARMGHNQFWSRLDILIIFSENLIIMMRYSSLLGLLIFIMVWFRGPGTIKYMLFIM